MNAVQFKQVVLALARNASVDLRSIQAFIAQYFTNCEKHEKNDGHGSETKSSQELRNFSDFGHSLS
jgi:hypothetical protein